MIQLTNNLWIGNSHDEQHADLATPGIGAVLNVAHDLHATRGWRDGVEYNQVGMVDGPGNPPATYLAAVLCLATLLERNKVLVCCHAGGRAMVVALMYMGMESRRDWDDLVVILKERLDCELPVPHDAHRAMFDKINWLALSAVAKEM